MSGETFEGRVRPEDTLVRVSEPRITHKDDEPDSATLDSAEALLETVETPKESADVLLQSGRRYSVEAKAEGDKLTVRAKNGQVMLRVTLTDAGPVLCFESADVEVRATRHLVLAGHLVDVQANMLRTTVQRDVKETIGGGRHTRIGAADQLEAAVIQAQANHGPVEVRAAAHIALDAEHIGLNDDPCPTPFGWSELAKQELEETIG